MPDQPAHSRPQLTLSRDQLKLVWHIDFILLVACVLLAVLIFFGGSGAKDGGGALVLIGLGCFGMGAFLGFLFSTFGDEKQSFSPVFTAINGLLGGATLADLLKADQSFIVKSARALGQGAGLPADRYALIFAIAAACVPLGFFVAYFNRTLLLNPFQKKIDDTLGAAKTALLAISPVPDLDPEVPADPETAQLAKKILNRPGAGQEGSFDDLFNDGKAYYVLGRIDDALSTFQRCLAQRPGHPGSMLYQAAALIDLKNYLPAIDVLESLVNKPQAPIEAWKLLGYASLFYPGNRPEHADKLRRAIAASRAYLNLHPDDPGAQLNLACAYGQLGPANAEARAALRESLPPLAALPALKSRINDLTQPGDDFAAWTGDPEFSELFKKIAAP